MKLTPTDQPEPAPEFVELVGRVLDHEASLEDIAQLNALLPRDPDALRYFVKMRMLHAALEDEFGAVTGEIDSITGRGGRQAAGKIAAFPGRHPAGRRNRLRYWAAAAIILLSTVALFWGGTRLVKRPAFEIVARYGTGTTAVPPTGHWLRNGDHLSFDTGAVELRSLDGNTITLKGPAHLVVRNRQALTIRSGVLWAALEGDPLRIRTHQGEVTDLGTTFGIDQSSEEQTRLDVFDGRISLTDLDDPSLQVEAGTGEGLLCHGSRWPPERQAADASRYTGGLRGPLGIVFTGSAEQASLILSSRPRNAQWTPVSDLVGSVHPSDAPFEFAWAGTSIFSTGSAASPEAALFRTHLIGYPANIPSRQALHRQAEALGLPMENHGIILRFSGMSAWLDEIGASSYRIILLRNSAIPDVEFLPVTASSELPPGESTLELHKLWQDDYRPANYPDSPDGTGARAFDLFETSFTADILHLTLPVQNEGAIRRTNISAIIVEPQF